jgi:predicted ArsR family transcriptional regulator
MQRKSGITAEVVRVLAENADEEAPMRDTDVEALVTLPLSSNRIVRSTLHFLAHRGVAKFVERPGAYGRPVKFFWLVDPDAELDRACRERDKDEGREEETKFDKGAMIRLAKIGHAMSRSGVEYRRAA